MSTNHDEVVLLNDLTRYGLRRVHVMRMGHPVCKERWAEQVPADGMELLSYLIYEEKDLGVWHLWLMWNAREVVDLKVVQGEAVKTECKAVLWWVKREERAREAIGEAAARHYVDLDVDADVVYMAEIPRGAPRDAAGQALPLELEVIGKMVSLELKEASWMPKGYLMLMKGDGHENRE